MKSGEQSMLTLKRTRKLEEIEKELKRKEEEIETLSQDVPSCSKENNQIQQRVSNIEHTIKPLDQIGQKQRSRRLKTIKGEVGAALWFLESYGLKLSFLKAKETKTGKEVSFVPTDKDADDKQTIEQVLFLLDKFCSSDEVYHELSI